MAQRNLKVGAIKDVSGEVNIAGGDIYKGYTSEQVAVLLKKITTTFTPKPFDGRCPYKGLDVFEEEDAELFFGRERLVEDLVGRLKESRTVFITGPSGSGKSSLVRAGLIHTLKQGAIKNLHSERWLYETMKPGREPIKDLALAFSRFKSPELADYFRAHANEINVLHDCAESVLSGRKDQRFVLFVDQFEEVFTQISQEEERLVFLNMLASAGTVENGRVIVLFAMRSDFVSNCATYPALNELLSQQFRQIGAMQPEELVSAIALPAKHVGLPIEDELIARIINDMKGEPGALPLMQFALKDLFDSQQEKGGLLALTLEDYLRQGGIHKSLERHADHSFAKLSEGEQELARSVFSGLIEIGRGTQDTRRTALFDELVPANTNAEDVEAIVQKLADARLIITDEQAGKDTVTISHEKLIDAWPWLKKLVNENRDVIALQNEIASDAKEWDDHKRDPSYLYTGARLINAGEQLNSKKLVLSGLAQEFVEAGRARQRRGQVFLTAAVSTIITLLIIAVIVFRKQSTVSAQLAEQAQAASTLAVAQQGTAQANAQMAERQANLARLRELASQSALLRERRLQTSLLLGLEVFMQEDNPQTRGVLLDNVQSHPQLQQYLNGHSSGVYSVAFSPDGKLLASGSADNTIILWEMNTRERVGQPLTGHTGPVNSVAFSPDGELLASGSADSTIILWDVNTHEPIGPPLVGQISLVNSVAFSPDGEILASGSNDGSIILWDVNTHEPIGQPLAGHDSPINKIAFSPNGILASGSDDSTIILWDVNTHERLGQPLAGHKGSVYSLAFRPDGEMLASGSDDNNIILWNVAMQQPIGQPLTGHASRVDSLAFSPNGETLASGSYDSTIILWDVNAHESIGQSLTGHSDWLFSLAFSPDGKLLASGSADNMIALWDIEQRQSIGQPLTGQSGRINSVAFRSDGKILVSGSYRGTIFVWDVNARESIGQPLSGHSDWLFSLAFSPDGKLLASGSADKTIILWDVNTHEPIGPPLAGHTGPVNSVAFSPSGILASGSTDSIILWDVDTHEPIGPPLLHSGSVKSVAFSADGEILASGSGTIILWDVDTHEPLGPPLLQGSVNSVTFSPDGRILASASDDSTIILWDVDTHERIGQPLTGHSGSVNSLAFSPDGKILASSGFDGRIILWDVNTHQPIGQALIGHTGSVYGIAFSPNGEMLASGSVDNTVILWNVNPQSWIAKTCQRVGRNFTRAEWAQYFPDEEYHKTCEQWPPEPETGPSSSRTP